MTHTYCLPSGSYVNITVTVMKLTTQSSISLCSYLPLTLNILLTIPLTLTLNPIPSLDAGDQISHPHKMNRTSDLQMWTWNIVNWMAASVNLLFLPPPRSCSFSHCQDITCLKPDLQQSGSGRVQLKRDGTWQCKEGKWRGKWQMEWVASTLYTMSEHGVSSITTADAHTLAAGSRLNWRRPPI